MAGKGGYQAPRRPAAVSGPGQFSQRTDGGPTEDNMAQAARYVSGQDYGDGQELMDVQQSAPLASAPDVPRRAVVPLAAPSQRPDEPVTAGNPLGDGPGPDAWQSQFPEPDAVASAVRAAYEAYPSPYLRVLLARLEAGGR